MLLSIIEKLKEISKDYSKNDNGYLGFNLNIDENAKKKLLRKCIVGNLF